MRFRKDIALFVCSFLVQKQLHLLACDRHFSISLWESCSIIFHSDKRFEEQWPKNLSVFFPLIVFTSQRLSIDMINLNNDCLPMKYFWHWIILTLQSSHEYILNWWISRPMYFSFYLCPILNQSFYRIPPTLIPEVRRIRW